MRNKCIILARVSTEQQSLEVQTNELVKTAMRDGYERENLIVINNKESVIKNDEEHTLGLTQLKAEIESDPSINCVYCREISRVGRRYDVLSNIKTFLVNHRVQLVVDGDSRIELLDKNGDITIQGGVMFEIACQVAVQEMKDKKIRFAQGRARAIAKGKAGQGNVLYGYTTDAQKYVIVDEEKADIVRWIFDTYVNNNISCKGIYRELVANGTWQRLTNDDCGSDKVRKILGNTAYSGNNKSNEIKYLAIVSSDIQAQAIDKMKRAKTQPKTTSKHVWLAKSLVKCTCGHTMLASQNVGCYVCPTCKRHLALNYLEYIVWNEAQVIKHLKMCRDTNEEKEKATETIRENAKKLEAAKKKLLELEELEIKAAESALVISNNEKREAFLARKTESFTRERKEVNELILRYTQESSRLEKFLKSLDEKNGVTKPSLYIAAIDNDVKKKEIINEVVEQVKVEDIDDKHVRYTVVPKKTMFNYSVNYPIYYVYDRTKKTYPRLLRYVEGSDNAEDVTSEVVKKVRRTNTKPSKKVA